MLRSIDKQLQLTQKVAAALPDHRDARKTQHNTEKLLRQRIYALACGDEDLNDHNELRDDIALQTAVETEATLASTATMQRFEQRFNRNALKATHEILIQQFIDSYDQPPKELILDFDATDNRLFGDQDGRHYLHHYRSYCYLPLYVFCGDRLLTALLRPASKGGNWLTLFVLKALVKRLRRAWPQVRIVYRGDSGFYHPKVVQWCDASNVEFLVGYSVNETLKKHEDIAELKKCTQKAFEASGENQKWFTELDDYQARRWNKPYRLVAKYEFSTAGENLRFVLTSLDYEMEALYSEHYCARGDMENRIKEQKWLFSDRSSCQHWWPNQFRLLVSGLAYTLLERLRHIGLAGTEAERWQVKRLREKLMKVSAVVTRNTRRIKFMASSIISHTRQALFYHAARRLNSTPT